MSTYTGKRALITGGSTGLGLSLAKQMAQQGADVTILSRSQAKLEAACAEINGLRASPGQKIESIQADVTNLPEITAALDEFLCQHQAPDYVFNCAGSAWPGLLVDQNLDDYRSSMELNYFGTLYVSKLLIPAMIQRKGGHIVNISSIGGFLSLVGYSTYCPSKFAVRALSDTMRYELAEYGIKTSVVFPPDMLTPGLEHENTLKPAITKKMDENNKAMTPDAVAAIVLKAVAKGRYFITPGSDSTLYHIAVSSVGYLTYRIMDSLLADARRKLNGSKNLSAH